MRFSQRIGEKERQKPLQEKSLDDDLRNSLWNAIKLNVIDQLPGYSQFDEAEFSIFAKQLWIEFFKKPVDDIPTSGSSISKSNTTRRIKKWFYDAEWFEVYDLVDYCLRNEVDIDKRKMKQFLNNILEKENSAYRVIEGKLAPITNELELTEIEEALDVKKFTGLEEVNVHLQNALDKLSDKENPDYRNSIKESISAVEALVNKVNSSEKESLGTALNKIDASVNIHKALKGGFKKIYGYTSDSDGIRHALSDLPNCNFEDAKYMLVSCSAFINYLISKADKAGIKFK